MAGFLDLDFSDVKPSLISWVIVGLMATTFIVGMKYLFTRYPVRGLTEIFQAA